MKPAVVAYCLMTNHLHLVAVPQNEDSLGKALGQAHFRYTRYVNRLHGRSGHLWQSRFFSCPLGPSHLTRALLCVERNPVRAGMARNACDYSWSSAGAHVEGTHIIRVETSENAAGKRIAIGEVGPKRAITVKMT